MSRSLKEDPREWRKFTLSFTVMLSLLLWGMSRLGKVEGLQVYALAGTLVSAAGVAIVRPKWCRGFYRAGMGVGMLVGGWVISILLAVVFVVMVVPMGFVMRCVGYDPLELRAKPPGTSYWRKAGKLSGLDRLF